MKVVQNDGNGLDLRIKDIKALGKKKRIKKKRKRKHVVEDESRKSKRQKEKKKCVAREGRVKGQKRKNKIK